LPAVKVDPTRAVPVIAGYAVIAGTDACVDPNQSV
jgi:hypothetical protein